MQFSFVDSSTLNTYICAESRSCRTILSLISAIYFAGELHSYHSDIAALLLTLPASKLEQAVDPRLS